MSDLAIIVPVYNRVKCTNNLIECLKKNTCKAWTLFIVDDGSTDGTDRMLTDISTRIDTDIQVPLKDGTIYHIKGGGN